MLDGFFVHGKRAEIGVTKSAGQAYKPTIGRAARSRRRKTEVVSEVSGAFTERPPRSDDRGYDVN
jgi:hypothetical protein